jgi:hypothetical protein
LYLQSVWFKRKGEEGRRGNLMEGRGRERRGGILIKYVFGSNERMRGEVFIRYKLYIRAKKI